VSHARSSNTTASGLTLCKVFVIAVAAFGSPWCMWFFQLAHRGRLFIPYSLSPHFWVTQAPSMLVKDLE
jgi:hypothetical protein